MTSQQEKAFNDFWFILNTGNCPICKKQMNDTSDCMIEDARDATVLLRCDECEILIGRTT